MGAPDKVPDRTDPGTTTASRPWAAVVGLAAFAVQVPLARRVG